MKILVLFLDFNLSHYKPRCGASFQRMWSNLSNKISHKSDSLNPAVSFYFNVNPCGESDQLIVYLNLAKNG